MANENLFELLLDAIQKGSLEEVKSIVSICDRRYPVFEASKYIEHAVERDHLLISKYLFDRYGHKIGQDNREFLLERCVRKGSLDLVKHLHKHGVNISCHSNEPLMEAAKGGFLDIVSYLREQGVDLSARLNTPICEAATYGHLEVVTHLHMHGISVRVREDEPLMCAAENGHTKVVSYLLNNGVSAISRNGEALRSACMKGHMDVVMLLFQEHKRVNYPIGDCLKYALKYGQIEVAQFLIDQGERPNIRWSMPDESREFLRVLRDSVKLNGRIRSASCKKMSSPPVDLSL